MRRLGGSPLFLELSLFKSSSTKTRLWTYQTRQLGKKPLKRGEPMRPRYPAPYYIPDHILDLDAEDAQGVRAYDEDEGCGSEPVLDSTERGFELARERVAHFEDKYREYTSIAKSMVNDQYSIWHINDMDIMSVALTPRFDSKNMTVVPMETPRKDLEEDLRENWLEAVLDSSGIPHLVRDDPSKTVTYMLHRQHPNPFGFLPGQDELLKEAVNACRSHTQLMRLVQINTRTPHGCQMLWNLSSEICASLHRVNEKRKRFDVMLFLINLTMNMERHGLSIPTDICNYCIKASIRCQVVTTVHSYLEKMLNNGDALSEDYIVSLLDSLLTAITQSQRHPMIIVQNKDRLMALYSLLTGYVPGEDQLRVSIRSLFNPDQKAVFCRYIDCLVRLGAFRTLWHESHTLSSPSPPRESPDAQEAPHLEGEKYEYFINEMHYSLAKMGKGKLNDLAKETGLGNATGEYRDDCQLDMIAILRSAEILVKPKKKFEKANLPGYLRSPSATRDCESIREIMREKGIQKAMTSLQTFLVQEDTLL